jgi:2-oxoglutarate ferredoxin oxidoreductase subunit alpha
MVRTRAAKIERIANDIPLQEVDGDDQGNMLVVGWGSTYGSIKSAVNDVRERGVPVSFIHLQYINPFPKNLGEILYRFKNILVPEMNNGQLVSQVEVSRSQWASTDPGSSIDDGRD